MDSNIFSNDEKNKTKQNGCQPEISGIASEIVPKEICDSSAVRELLPTEPHWSVLRTGCCLDEGATLLLWNHAELLLLTSRMAAVSPAPTCLKLVARHLDFC